MKISRKRKAVRQAFALPRPKHPCPNCGQPGPHFMPPSLGEPGMWMCDITPQDIAETKPPRVGWEL